MPKINQTICILAIIALCLCLSACGGSSDRSVSRTNPSSVAVHPSESLTGDYDGDDEYDHKGGSDDDNDDSTQPKDKDNDSDNRTGSYFDKDDASVLDFGHAGGHADRRAIASLVKRYFAAADTDDGATACSLIVPSFASAIVEDYGRSGGPLYARGDSCPAVMSKVFRHYHRQLVAHQATLRVAAVRVDGATGVATLAFKALPGRQLRVERAGKGWRVDALLDLELP